MVDADWHAFCQAIYEGIEGSDWWKLYAYSKEVSRAAGVRKPSGSQKAKAFCKMNAARDSGDDFYDPERKDQRFGKKQNTTGIVGRAPQRPNCGTGQSFELCGKSVSRLAIGSRLVVELVFGLWPRGLKHGAKGVGQTFVEKGLALLVSLGQCAFARSLHALECPKEV